MLRTLEDSLCRSMDRDTAWWGIRRLKPVPRGPYSSRTLLLVCLAIGTPLATIVYGAAYATSLLAASTNPLRDDTDWFLAAAAWASFVLNAVMQGIGCWEWNRRAV